MDQQTAELPQPNQPNQPPQPSDWVGKDLDWLSQVRIADHARMMCNNQAAMNAVNQSDREYRNLSSSVMRDYSGMGKSLFCGAGPESSKDSAATDGEAAMPADDMNIKVGSPETHHHFHAAPAPAIEAVKPAVKKGLGTLGKIALAAALTGGIGGPAALATHWLLNRPAAPVAKPEQNPQNIFGLDLLPPDQPK